MMHYHQYVNVKECFVCVACTHKLGIFLIYFRPVESPSTEPLSSMGESQDAGTTMTTMADQRPLIKRSESERLLAVNRDFVTQEKELREKYHETIFSTAEKIMQSSQENQTKALKGQFDMEIAELMRRLEADRRDQVKALAKKHRDRDELVRVKREVASNVVDRGVLEREKLDQAFQHRLADLEKQHEAVRNALADQRAKVRNEEEYCW